MTEFFAGTNTEKGFTGYLEEYFGDINKLYIIKGTPGSGKSTLMKRLASGCEEMGHTVWRIRCSSDPGSLDGIILPEKGKAIADGTAPHVLEPKYPLAKEVLIDVGRFMDEKRIDRAAVLAAAARKSTHYTRAYRYIKCGVAAERNRISTVAESLDKEKLYAFAERFFRKNLYSATAGSADRRVAAAFTGRGIHICDPFPEKKRLFVLSGGRGCESILLDLLKNIALGEGEKVTLCPDATDSEKINGIYFHGKGAYVTLLNIENGEKVNLSRFFRSGEGADSRAVIKESSLLAKSAYSLAEKELSLAAGYHGVLEQIYIAAIDFSLLDGEYKRLIKGLTE